MGRDRKGSKRKCVCVWGITLNKNVFVSKQVMVWHKALAVIPSFFSYLVAFAFPLLHVWCRDVAVCWPVLIVLTLPL